LSALAGLAYENQDIATLLPNDCVQYIKSLLQKPKSRTRLYACSVYDNRLLGVVHPIDCMFECI